VSEVVGQGKTIATAMDWTDFDADDQTTLALDLVTNYDRATLLLWLTVLKDELKDKRNDYEGLCLARLAQVLPEGVAVTILADRGFGDAKLFAYLYLDRLGFAYVIRFRGNIHVTATNGRTRADVAWVGTGGRARKLRDVEVTAGRHQVASVVCVKAKDMKETWCLGASNARGDCTKGTSRPAPGWRPPFPSDRGACRADPLNGRRAVGHHARRAAGKTGQAWRRCCDRHALAVLQASEHHAQKKTAHAAEQRRSAVNEAQQSAWNFKAQENGFGIFDC
jgi:hypothetical protein